MNEAVQKLVICAFEFVDCAFPVLKWRVSPTAFKRLVAHLSGFSRQCAISSVVAKRV